MPDTFFGRFMRLIFWIADLSLTKRVKSIGAFTKNSMALMLFCLFSLGRRPTIEGLDRIWSGLVQTHGFRSISRPTQPDYRIGRGFPATDLLLLIGLQ